LGGVHRSERPRSLDLDVPRATPDLSCVGGIMVDDKEEVGRQLEAILAELQTVRDEIRVRIHLAGMELRDKWKELEVRVEEIERRRPEATQKVRDAAADLRDAFRVLRDKLG
jgi:hypothetical protein